MQHVVSNAVHTGKSKHSAIRDNPHSSLASVISIADNDQLLEHLRESQARCEDTWFLHTKAKLQVADSGVHLRHGVICVTHEASSLPVVPPSDQVLIKTILKELHVGPLGGHVAARKLFNLVRSRFYWRTMRADIERFCKECIVC